MCWRDRLSNREWNLQCGGELGRWLVEQGDRIRAERAREAERVAREQASNPSADSRAAHDENIQ